MPKMKTKGAVKKRFRVSKTGKVISNRPSRGHMKAKNSSKRRRALNSRLVLPPNWSRLIVRLLGR